MLCSLPSRTSLKWTCWSVQFGGTWTPVVPQNSSHSSVTECPTMLRPGTGELLLLSASWTHDYSIMLPYLDSVWMHQNGRWHLWRNKIKGYIIMLLIYIIILRCDQTLLIKVKEYIVRAKAWRNRLWPKSEGGRGRPSSYLISLLVLRAYENQQSRRYTGYSHNEARRWGREASTDRLYYMTFFCTIQHNWRAEEHCT